MKNGKSILLLLIISGLAACSPAETFSAPTLTPPPAPTHRPTITPTRTRRPTQTVTPSPTILPPTAIPTNGELRADGFAEYSSTAVLTEHPDFSSRVPVFVIGYPPDWQYGWVGDSGVIALMISSGDVRSAFSGRDPSGAYMMVIPMTYAGQKLAELFYSTLNTRSPLEPSQNTSINGQEAAIAEYTRDQDTFIEAVIVRGNWALLIVAKLPTEKTAEFRPLIETMIYTVVIQ